MANTYVHRLGQDRQVALGGCGGSSESRPFRVVDELRIVVDFLGAHIS